MPILDECTAAGPTTVKKHALSGFTALALILAVVTFRWDREVSPVQHILKYTSN